MARYSKQEQKEARERLLGWLKPGDTVYTIIRNVSRSGMSRDIGLVIFRDGVDLHPNYAVSALLGWGMGKSRDSIRVSGCGMDMGFHVVSTLSAVLFPEGFTCTGKDCPSNDHTNGDRDYSPHPHKSGDYALKQRWL